MILTASSHTTDAEPMVGRQWNFTKVDSPASFTNRNVWIPKPSIMRKERGMALSDISHICMWTLSGLSDDQSQKVSWAEAACG